MTKVLEIWSFFRYNRFIKSGYPKASDYKAGIDAVKKGGIMQNQKTIINRDFEIVKVERIDGQMTNEEGRTFDWHNYKVHFKAIDSPLVMTAKVDRVFNDYIEEDTYA